jgi:hypothetical protein
MLTHSRVKVYSSSRLSRQEITQRWRERSSIVCAINGGIPLATFKSTTMSGLSFLIIILTGTVLYFILILEKEENFDFSLKKKLPFEHM